MGKISDAMLLEILRRGEVLPDNINVEDEAEYARNDMEAPDLIEASEDTDEEETDDEAEMTPDRVDRLIELLSR
jgi:hypothetical protein